MSEDNNSNEDPRITRHKVIQAMEGRKKSHLIAFFLCLIAGFWGAHRYYLGDKKRGQFMTGAWVIILLISAVFGFVGHAIAGAIWGFGEVYASLNFYLIELASYTYNGSFLSRLDFILEFSQGLTPSWILTSGLRIAFGALVIWELFTVIQITDKKNEELRRQVEKEFGI